MNKRINYFELKESYLDDAYGWCRNKLENGLVMKVNMVEHYIHLKTHLILLLRI